MYEHWNTIYTHLHKDCKAVKHSIKKDWYIHTFPLVQFSI